jgi:acetyltransferase
MAHDVFEGARPLHAVFHPANVAVIGATAEPHTLGHRVFSGLQNNSFGFPVYRALDDAPASVDLAVVVTTGDEALDAIERCAASGVNGVVVLSGVEGTPEHRRGFERRVGELLHKSRTKLIGPRCFALMNPSVGLNVSPGLPMPVAGNVAFIAQSSSLATTIIDWSHKGIVGFSAFVALGDMLDVGWGNLIDYFGADWATRAICIHMESIVNMRSFLSAARAVALQKPIIVIKAGRSEAAATAFSWHRSCHVSDDGVFDAALRRVGVIRVDRIEDLFHVADALSKQPRPRGSRLSIVTNAGGPGVLAADHIVKAGTLVPHLDQSSDDSARAVESFDVLGDGSSAPFLQAAEKSAQDPANDALLLLLVPHAMSDPGTALQGLLTIESRNKPVLLCLRPVRPRFQWNRKRSCAHVFRFLRPPAPPHAPSATCGATVTTSSRFMKLPSYTPTRPIAISGNRLVS